MCGRDTHPQAVYTTHSPQAGTHTKTIILTIVDMVVGMHPMNSLCFGRSVAMLHVSDHMIPRKIETRRKKMNSTRLSTKTMTDSQYSQRTW